MAPLGLPAASACFIMYIPSNGVIAGNNHSMFPTESRAPCDPRPVTQPLSTIHSSGRAHSHLELSIKSHLMSYHVVQWFWSLYQLCITGQLDHWQCVILAIHGCIIWWLCWSPCSIAVHMQLCVICLVCISSGCLGLTGQKQQIAVFSNLIGYKKLHIWGPIWCFVVLWHLQVK